MQTHGGSSIYSYRFFLCIESGCVYLEVYRAMHRGGHWPAVDADSAIIIKTVFKWRRSICYEQCPRAV